MSHQYQEINSEETELKMVSILSITEGLYNLTDYFNAQFKWLCRENKRK